MKHLVYNNDDAHMAWAGDMLRLTGPWPVDTKTIGIDDDGKLLCVVLYNMFVEASCTAHIVSTRDRNWATRSVLAAVFAYPFVQLGLNRITTPVARRNVDVQVFSLKLGFSFEGVLRGAHNDGDDEVLLGMLRSECRWIRGVNAHG